MWNRNEREDEGARPSAVPRPVPEPQRAVARIGKSIIIKGDVISSEDLIIDGRVEGTIEMSGHGLAIGVGASIKAELVAKTITISGAVTGNVTARGKVEIRETGSVDGDIRAPRIAMADGAVLRGRVDTGQPQAAAQDDQHQLFPVAV